MLKSFLETRKWRAKQGIFSKKLNAACILYYNRPAIKCKQYALRQMMFV